MLSSLLEISLPRFAMLTVHKHTLKIISHKGINMNETLAYEQGWLAFGNEKAINPYPLNTKESIDWHAGWSNAAFNYDMKNDPYEANYPKM